MLGLQLRIFPEQLRLFRLQPGQLRKLLLFDHLHRLQARIRDQQWCLCGLQCPQLRYLQQLNLCLYRLLDLLLLQQRSLPALQRPGLCILQWLQHLPKLQQQHRLHQRRICLLRL